MTSILEKVDVFAGLPSESLLELEALAIRRHYAKGVPVFYEGEPVEHLLVLIEGRLKLFHSNDAGREYVYGVAEPGLSFGGIGLLTDEVRTVCAEAEDDCVFLSIARSNFLDFVATHPQIKDALLAGSIRLIKHLTKTVSDLALNDVYGRIRRVFEMLAVNTPEGDLIEGQITQQDLADRVGASREMIAKVMKELVAGGYVETGRRRILILKKLPERF
ncbi:MULTISPECIES: Crp/Fnr family transcriptional regulator [Chitinibacter]|jgi:CRP-like cAMP-binding protein|uniref:Crp/Fnr family transcriptional regulator n=1 Tax=Chitinibacter TaxID=230666 RepID=UPI00064675A0|nr:MULTISPECIES: Crp/Fnr family transcriptional regulator [Chitinibacter]